MTILISQNFFLKTKKLDRHKVCMKIIVPENEGMIVGGDYIIVSWQQENIWHVYQLLYDKEQRNNKVFVNRKIEMKK